MLDYTEATNAVYDGDGTVFAATLNWPFPVYIGLNEGVLWIYGMTSGGSAYEPTEEDQQATNWLKGGSRPPAR